MFIYLTTHFYFGISLSHWLVILSALLGLSGSITYIYDIVKGKSKPNLITWGLWAATPLVATGAALSAHADPWATVRIFASGFGPLLVFVTALLFRQSYWRLEKFDYACGSLSLIALILWLFADLPLYAILFAAAADLFATIPTILKSWNHPETETFYTYLVGLFTALIIIPAIPIWNIENAAFQVYLMVANVSLLLAIMFGKLRKKTIAL